MLFKIGDILVPEDFLFEISSAAREFLTKNEKVRVVEVAINTPWPYSIKRCRDDFEIPVHWSGVHFKRYNDPFTLDAIDA